MHDPTIRPSRFWWIAVVRGVFSLMLGAAALFTENDRAMLANFLGVYWLLSGVLTIRWAVTVRWLRGSRIGLAAGGVSVIAAAMVLLRQPLEDLISLDALIGVLGVAALLMGSLRLLGAFELERRTGRRWTFGGLALGSVEIVLGLILLFARGGNAHVLTVTLAVWGLVGGSLLLIEGFRLRRFAQFGSPGEVVGTDPDG